MEPLRVVFGRDWYPSASWRARIAEINARLEDQDDDLAIAFTHAVKTLGEAGELAGQEELDRIVASHNELFPGEAGHRLAWGIATRTPPNRHAPGPVGVRLGGAVEGEIIDVFARDDPAYQRPGRGRPHRDDDRDIYQRVLDWLREREEHGKLRLPHNFRDAARQLQITPLQLQRILWRVRRHGVPIRKAKRHQQYVDWVRRFNAAPPPKADRVEPGGIAGAPNDGARNTTGIAGEGLAIQTSRCASHPDWSFSGTAEECAAAWRQHRQEAHDEE